MQDENKDRKELDRRSEREPEARPKAYEKPILTEMELESEEAVLGACRIVAVACTTYHY